MRVLTDLKAPHSLSDVRKALDILERRYRLAERQRELYESKYRARKRSQEVHHAL